jgi:hypothetical protein
LYYCMSLGNHPVGTACNGWPEGLRHVHSDVANDDKRRLRPTVIQLGGLKFRKREAETVQAL